MGKAFAYLIAAHVQVIGIVFMAWWLGTWLNVNHPIGFNWLYITIPFGILAMVHSFYLIIRSLIWQKRAAESQGVKRG